MEEEERARNISQARIEGAMIFFFYLKTIFFCWDEKLSKIIVIIKIQQQSSHMHVIRLIMNGEYFFQTVQEHKLNQ